MNGYTVQRFMPLAAKIVRAWRYNLEHGLIPIPAICKELNDFADQLDSWRVTDEKQYAVLVTAGSGDKYTIGPFSSHDEASKVGRKLEFAAGWIIIRNVHDHM